MTHEEVQFLADRSSFLIFSPFVSQRLCRLQFTSVPFLSFDGEFLSFDEESSLYLSMLRRNKSSPSLTLGG